MPRGCLDTALSLLHDNGIACEITDERFAGTACDVTFLGKLRPDQETAVSELLRHDCGVLCAPTAFGKTVTAAAAIARRKVNTLVLVHRTELLKQWQERLRLFLQTSNDIGVIGGGKNKPGGDIDIAVMQSISRHGEVDPLVKNYSFMSAHSRKEYLSSVKQMQTNGEFYIVKKLPTMISTLKLR